MRLADQLRVLNAVNDVTKGCPVRTASQRHDVNRHYLYRRLWGVSTREDVNERQQRLSKAQETLLASWIVVQGRLGYCSFPYAISNVKMIFGKSINFQRINGATSEYINQFFDGFDSELVRNIPPQYNITLTRLDGSRGTGKTI
ncbi:hypothetical protein K469DRAFT_378348 [Zopfia rhizophila CBS 207.26]|uniref:HTH psq-type domain-containing protein n=1 Tax=Zopfia rhizophila CBS 207.26 TaxID=1314779 RepID=A0A6A6DDU5_9PEZI|nr:hypothetical protein K469DRAFT_378348 [Zopfia rhizophila CBS 207.26]